MDDFNLASMLSEKTSPFDAIAHNYDDAFSKSLIGYHQRQITRKHLQKFLSGKPPLKILEINCGTGEDAIWLASLGHQVIATDQSEQMISVARQKVSINVQSNNPAFLVCDFEELDAKFPSDKFDLVFSNFSGLNCVSEIQLSQVSLHLHALLKKAGTIAIVIFGKYTWWETMYYTFKADFRKAFRICHNHKVAYPL